MSEIDKFNATYWDEPCGTTRLEYLDVVKADPNHPEILAAFDRFFFEFYPYLERHIPFSAVAGKSVLEVGLGMGSVSERLARFGARLTGLDIAAGPVAMVNERLERAALPGGAQVGNILHAPFADESFDLVVSLGCLHHTGDLPRALREVHRVLKPGGLAVIMVYYAYSPKRWVLWPRETLRHLLVSSRAPQAVVEATASERAGYDQATDGGAPPETVFTSKRQLRAYAEAFASVSITLENLDTDMLLYFVSRRARQTIRPVLLRIGDAAGIATEDMYATLQK